VFGPTYDKLTEKQQAFLREYVALGCSQKAEAARRAGYQGEGHNLSQQAYQVLQSIEVKACLSFFQRSELMPAAEVLQRLSGMARADMTAVFEEVITPRDGKSPLVSYRVKEGMGWLVRSIITNDRGETKYELHDAKDALKIMAKYHGILEQVLKIKELPSDPKELALLLAREVERTTGLRVESAGSKKEGN
jgi:hypothetical protein